MKRLAWVAVVGLVLASLACSTPRPGLPKATPTPLPPVQLGGEEAVLIELYERANPAVVNIDVSGALDETLTDFGSGSGFVIDEQGHIVTNNHVVVDAAEMRVTFWDGRVAKASLVGRDPYSDLAVIKVDVPASWLTPLPLGDSSSLRVGQRVVAIGNPFGLRGSMTVGIVSALGRSLQADASGEGGRFQNPDIIQTDAAINPGNSGGPLLNLQGQVVGINSAIRTEGLTRANSGVGFAVPSNTIGRVVPQLIETGTASYTYLGISVDRNFSLAELAAEIDMPAEQGVLIDSVLAGQPAAQAGLRGGSRQVQVRGVPVQVDGDIITAVDGVPVRDFDELIIYLINETEVGQTVTLTIIRNGQPMQVAVKLAARPQADE